MNIYKEMPESTKPEKAWIDKEMLCVDFHLWDSNMFYYVDMHHDIPLTGIVGYTMCFGSRKGFKKMEMYFRDLKDRHLTLLKLSNSHEKLAIDIYNLLKPLNIKPRRKIVTTKEVKHVN